MYLSRRKRVETGTVEGETPSVIRIKDWEVSPLDGPRT